MRAIQLSIPACNHMDHLKLADIVALRDNKTSDTAIHECVLFETARNITHPSCMTYRCLYMSGKYESIQENTRFHLGYRL